MTGADERDTLQRAAVLAPARWDWARQWEFWLAVALGAALRLIWLNLTQYLDDQTRLMVLARASVTHGVIPLTGIPSSIHTLNPPLSVYLLLPFAAFTADPMPVVISVALWNVIGVALCYIFTLRYFGRRVAAVSALLFATCGAAINYSRFIWQQNYLPTLLILWALTLYLGCVEGRRRWFAANVTLLSLAALLHPVAALLAPVTLIGAVLAPRIPRWRAWITSALIILALAAPTLYWEKLSDFFDVRAARHYALGSAHINPAVFYYLYEAIGGPTASIPHASLALTALNVIAALLFAAGWLVLSARILRPARVLPWRRERGLLVATRVWLVALYRGLRASVPWRINLLLWLSVSLPVALMIRHSAALFAHYLMVLYPTAFIVSGIGAVSGMRWLARLARARDARIGGWVALALEVSLALLLAARSVQWLSVPASLTNAATFHAIGTSGKEYGYPLSVIQGGAKDLALLQQHTGASTVEVITPSDPRYKLPADYIFAGARADRVTLAQSCLLLPSASSSESWLITSATGSLHSPAMDLLATLPHAQTIGTYSMVGGPAYPVYQVNGQVGAPLSMRTVSPAVFSDGQGDAIQITGAESLASGKVALRWNIIAARAPEAESRYFTLAATLGGVTGSTTCEAQRWQTGETLYTIMSLSPTDTFQLTARTGTDGLDIHTAGGLRFLSALDGGQPAAPMRATLATTGETQLVARVNPDGSLMIPPP